MQPDLPIDDSKALWHKVAAQLPRHDIKLGVASAATYVSDPRMLAFMASRYKFVSKMIQGSDSAIEIGCGDGFGAPLVAQTVKKLICTDIHEETLADCRARLSIFKNIEFNYADFRQAVHSDKSSAAFCVDVIEHISPHEEAAFLQNIAKSIKPYGVFLVGTPNLAANQYASENSKLGHINLKDYAGLQSQMLGYFHRVFMFSMNDEVLHTGYHAMSHYLWALCVAPREA